MAKINHKNSDYKETFFQEHLKKTADELYEWHLILYYYSESKLTHHILIDNSDTQDNNRLTYLCKEHRQKLIDSGEATYVGVMHDPKDHLFPPQYDCFLRSTIKTKCDEEYHRISLYYFQKVKETGSEYTPYFPKDAEKDFASILLRGKREDTLDILTIELHDINSFLILSRYARSLSIVYDNYFEYSAKLDMSEQKLYDHINSLKDYVMGQAHEMIGYWKLEEKTKKIFSEYGKKSGGREKNEAILSSITHEIKNGKETWSANNLWKHFRRKHNGPENMTDNNVYYWEDPAGKDELKEEGNPKGITFDTFRAYVTEAKKNSRSKK